MGYTTDFSGEFTVTPTLTPEHREYLVAFSQTRRMQRDATIAAVLPDPRREAAGLPLGEEAGYFVAGLGFYGQGEDHSVVQHSTPPAGQPGLWCQWIPTDDGTAIQWDGGEKFYEYPEWFVYLVEHFLRPWGYSLDGEVEWQGEDPEDRGILRVADNVVTTYEADCLTQNIHDEQALDSIAQLLDGREWEVGDLDEIAEVIRTTGRAVREPEPIAPFDEGQVGGAFDGFTVTSDAYPGL